MHDPQHKYRNFFVEIDHPLLEAMKYPGHLFVMSETPWQTARAPMLGEHNREILQERLKYTEDEMLGMISV